VTATGVTGRAVTTFIEGSYEYAAMQPQDGYIAVCWRSHKIDGEWMTAGWLQPDGKNFQVYTWDRNHIGVAISLTEGIKAVVRWNARGVTVNGQQPV